MQKRFWTRRPMRSRSMCGWGLPCRRAKSSTMRASRIILCGGSCRSYSVGRRPCIEDRAINYPSGKPAAERPAEEIQTGPVPWTVGEASQTGISMPGLQCPVFMALSSLLAFILKPPANFYNLRVRPPKHAPGLGFRYQRLHLCRHPLLGLRRHPERIRQALEILALNVLRVVDHVLSRAARTGPKESSREERITRRLETPSRRNAQGAPLSKMYPGGR